MRRRCSYGVARFFSGGAAWSAACIMLWISTAHGRALAAHRLSAARLAQPREVVRLRRRGHCRLSADGDPELDGPAADLRRAVGRAHRALGCRPPGNSVLVQLGILAAALVDIAFLTTLAVVAAARSSRGAIGAICVCWRCCGAPKNCAQIESRSHKRSLGRVYQRSPLSPSQIIAPAECGHMNH